MRRVPPDQWRPTGIEDLEPAAWNALRNPGSTVVVAGPGAGKTEFLAQRAAYLLQTGLCPPPRRILAISFKRDAAENLLARVKDRCAADQASRFTSMTFDAFTKGLLDRFIMTVPAAWRPTRPYQLVFHKRNERIQFLESILREAPVAWQTQVAGLREGTFEPRYVGAWRLPAEQRSPISGHEFAVVRWWQEHIRDGDASQLTFVLINRIAEFLIRLNPQIASALLMTYPFVFLDEFQDATYAHYDFLHSVFYGSNVILTAVGDDKQRIMGWAGARDDAFKRLEGDFRAQRVSLLLNHRSSHDLVRIQHVVACALDPDATEGTSNSERKVSGAAAMIWRFDTSSAEASYLATWIQEDRRSRGLEPRDYAILVKQKADKYEKQLAPRFAQVGLGLRNEAKEVGDITLQDLLADDLARTASAILRLAVQSRAPEAWATATKSLLRLRDVVGRDDAGARRVTDELTAFVAVVRGDLSEQAVDTEAARVLGERILCFLDLSAARRAFPQYSEGDDLRIAHDAFLVHLAECADSADTWSACVDMFDGVGQVPLMTVHKSKGLEYDTIIFVGLDDDAWWSHTAGDRDGLAVFFVALSRAKQRVVFTYCKGRGRQKVRDLYSLLSEAGVLELAL